MSSSALYENIYNFLLDSPSEHITAFSVIFQLIEDDAWYPKDVKRNNSSSDYSSEKELQSDFREISETR